MATSVTSTHFSQENFSCTPLKPQQFLQLRTIFPPNAAIVLLALICTIISSYGLLCILKCTNRGSASAATEPKLGNAGVEQKALNSFPIVEYTTESKLPGLDTACVICLSEFAVGERLRILPKCNHGFHTRCIDTWLGSHSSCPTCRHRLTETNKINMESTQPVEQ
ncbi:hypothetical protein V6N11_044229 [Hibiscus sabdariffa]|uniref:RING-type E3 ubiquitin transferase n=1 Tax=Hibiscus sabdariffa TaxID=183260 RepID=A0ABR2RFB4_9ROSI